MRKMARDVPFASSARLLPGGSSPWPPSGCVVAAVALLLASAAISAAAERPAPVKKDATKAASDAPRPPAGRIYQSLPGKTRTSMFGITAEGHKFVYVIDRSGSMGGAGTTALKAAKAELVASLKDLTSTDQFQIVFYNEQPRVFNPYGDGRAVFATDQHKALAEEFVDGITSLGGTRHDDALKLAAKLQPDVIFWITDADEPKLGPADIQRVNQMAAGITILALEFGSGPQKETDNFLVRIARANGGEHVYVDCRKEMEVRR